MDNQKNAEQAETNARPYQLRRLTDKDLWPVLDIIGKVFPDELSTIFAQLVSKEKSVEEVGVTVVMRLVVAVIKNMNVVHDEVYAFLSDVSGKPVAEIEEMAFGTTPMMIWDIVKSERNNGFFAAASKLF